MTEQLDGQMSLFDRDFSFGRMSQAPSVRPESETEKTTGAKTSRQFSRKLSGSSAKKSPMFLYLMAAGPNQEACWVTEMTDARFPLPGEYMTRSFGEQPSTLMAECSFPALPSGVSASLLSQILEQGTVQPRYYLSAKACMGILNRAKKRGKELPEILRQALENQIACLTESANCDD